MSARLVVRTPLPDLSKHFLSSRRVRRCPWGTAEVEALKGYSDFVNGTLCFFVGVIWVAVTFQAMPDKAVGLAIVLVPFGLLTLAGAYLIARFRIKNLL